jgi:hypothetical protein
MSASKSETTVSRTKTEAEGPEERRSKGAASLEEAMAQSDELAKAESEKAAKESGAAHDALTAETDEAIAQAGAELEARDDEVYGRTPEAESKPRGGAETA